MLRKKEKIKKFYDDAFEEMFKRVGFEKFDESFINVPFWYTKKEWTKDEEEGFKTWFIDEYRKRFKKSIKYAKDECMWFVFNYGWKTKEDPKSIAG